MARVVNVTAAKASLSFLLEQVERGEEIVITRAGKPIAVLRAYEPEPEPRSPGRLRGKIRMAPDFDELPPDIAKSVGARE